MPRITAKGLRNELNLSDPISGDLITLYYRLPSTKERTSYENAKLKRERNKLKFEIGEMRVKYGKAILLGFKETEIKEDGSMTGGFLKIEDGKEKIFASDHASPNYDPNWKELVESYAADLIAALATHVFDGVSIEDEEIISEEIIEDNIIEEEISEKK